MPLGAARILSASGGSSPQIQFLGTEVSAYNASTYNFGSKNFPEDGIAVVCAAISRETIARTITSISIGGTASKIGGTSASGSANTAIGYKVVTSGNYSLTVNTNANAERCLIDWFLITNYKNATPQDNDYNIASSGTSTVLNMTLPTNSLAVFTACANASGFNPNISWNNGTEVSDSVSENLRHSSAYLENTSGVHNETASWALSTDNSGTSAVWI